VGEIMTKKLKQCPFCGGEGKIIDKKDFRETAHQVQCQKCYSITDLYSYREDAITAWNTRTPDVNKEFDHLTIFKDMITTLKNMEWTGSPQMCAMCGEYKHHGHNSECSFVGTINKAYSQLENAIKQAEAVI